MTGDETFDGDLDRLMREHGVTPLDGKASGGPKNSGHSGLSRRAGDRLDRRTSAGTTDLDGRSTSSRRSDDARGTADASPADGTASTREHAALRARLTDAESARFTLEQTVAKLQAELHAVRDTLDRAEHDRDTFDRERRTLARQLDVERAAATPPRTVRDRFADRGVPIDVLADALLALLACDADGVLDALQVAHGASSAPLDALLDDRLVLTCGQGPCAPQSDSAIVVTVPVEHCEICGGSQIARRLARLDQVCADRDIQRIVVVGGSPVTRTLLRYHAGSLGVNIDTVDGRSRLSRRRAQRIERTTDLIVVWASTILDHATTNAFQSDDVPRVTVSFRGLARMIDAVVAHLEAQVAR